MKHVVKLLVFVIFVTTMTTVYSTLLGELITTGKLNTENELLKLKVLGTEKKHGGGGKYFSLATQLTLEANARLADIDQHLLCDCDFKFRAQMDEIRLQLTTVSNTLAACDTDKEQKKILQLHLNSLESSILNLKNRIYSILHDQPDQCKDILKHILDLLNGLQSYVARIVGSM